MIRVLLVSPISSEIAQHHQDRNIKAEYKANLQTLTYYFVLSYIYLEILLGVVVKMFLRYHLERQNFGSEILGLRTFLKLSNKLFSS